jgi:hypothetical protein
MIIQNEELTPSRSDVSNWSYNPIYFLTGIVLLLAFLCWLALPSKTVHLHAAARQNNTNVIHRLVAQGVNVDARYKEEMTALMVAASKGNRSSVEMLLMLGADKKIRDAKGKSALVHAQENQQTNVFDLLAAQ